jgi:alkyldihydroxyacetonephosphate synthase
MELSTIGGWIASASVGHASALLGGIEDLLLGLTVVLAGGEALELKPVPRSAAGPDLRRLFVSSEGTLGLITEATLACARLPSGRAWEAFRPQSFETGAALVREIVQRGYHPLVVRLMDGAEAASILAAAHYDGGALLVVGFDAFAPATGPQRMELKILARELGARPMGADLAETWWEHRHEDAWHQQVMGENASGKSGAITDILDVAAVWRHLPRLYEEVRDALLDHAEAVACGLAHPRRSGAALQFSFLLRAAGDDELEDLYDAAWREAMAACVRAGGTIAHHQGVGLLKVPYLTDELGGAGVKTLARIKQALDPEWVLNPGKVIAREHASPPRQGDEPPPL